LHAWATTIKDATDSITLEILGEALKAVAARLTDSQAKGEVETILATITRLAGAGSLYDRSFEALGEGLKAVTANPNFTDSQAKDVVEPVLAAIKDAAMENDPFALGTLSAVLGILPVKLTDSQAKDVAEPVLAAINHAGSGYDRARGEPVEALGEGLKAVAAKLTDSQARDAVEPVLAAMKRTANQTPGALGALSAVLGVLPVKLTDSQAKDAVELVLAAIEETNSHYREYLGAVGEGLKAVAAKLTDSQAKNVVELVLAAMKRAEHQTPDAFKTLSAMLGVLPIKLTDSQAKDVVELVLAAMKRATPGYDYSVSALGDGLKSVAVKLDAASAKAADSVVEKVLGKARDKATVAVYAEASAALTYHQPQEQQVTRIFHILRYPLTVGKPTEHLLARLEQVPGVQRSFHDNLWEAVEWAEDKHREGQLNGLALDTPMENRLSD
jgi:hypothetical protein